MRSHADALKDSWPDCPKCRQSATGVYGRWITCIRCLTWRWAGEHRQHCVVSPVLIARLS